MRKTLYEFQKPYQEKYRAKVSAKLRATREAERAAGVRQFGIRCLPEEAEQIKRLLKADCGARQQVLALMTEMLAEGMS